MCGICGIIDPLGVRREKVRRMMATLAHRGPDEEGLAVDQGIGFGHRRLSIIDLDSGRQPMSNEDGSVWIVFNGEIYNFGEIRRDLAARHRFKTRSDTEVILHLYEEKGESFLTYLRGMFAIAIYDFGRRTLLLARDHLGQKPLYYHHNASRFAFASEIKALLEIMPELRELDFQALHEYLTVRIITPPRSMFRRIRKLPPGHYLRFQDGRVEVKRYWDLRFEPKLKGDFGEVLEELERRLLDTIKYHLVSDVPIGAFLSGGMDSSLVVAMMSKVADGPVRTFAGDVPYAQYSELPYARMVSERYGTENRELTISPSLIRTLPDLVWHLDEPSDPLSVCMYSISELARREVKVVLGGDGGDELFGGYDRYYGNVLASYYALLPIRLRKHVFERLIQRLPEGFWYRSLGHQIKWMHQMSFYQGAERYAKSLSYFYFSEGHRDHPYTDDFRRRVAGFDPEAGIKEQFQTENAVELIDRMLHSDSLVRMPDHPNMILDRMTMAHGLEARSPFLDHKLAEFCASIPPRYKVRGTRRRLIQKALAKKYLPPALLKKKKQGFSSSLPYLLDAEFRLLYETFLTDSALVEDGLLNGPAIRSILSEHLDKRADHGNRLWLLCNAEVWYRMHIRNLGAEAIRERLQMPGSSDDLPRAASGRGI